MASRKKKPAGGRPRKKETPLSLWLDEHGVSRDDLAARLGIHRSSVDRLCSGLRRPKLALAIEIEKLTDGAVPASSWVQTPTRPNG